MIRLIARRAAWSLPLLWIGSALTFVLVSLVPGNAAQAILGGEASTAQVAALRAQLGLGQPLWVQYGRWLDHVGHGSLGDSLVTGQSVTSVLGSRLTVSLTLIIGGTLVACLLGVPLGVWAATRGGAAGALIEAGSVIGLAVPNFWLGLVLIDLFALRIRAFPATGFVPFSQGPALWARALVLPVAAIAAVGVTIVALQTRDCVRDVLGRDFVRVLAANGVPRGSILYRHVLRNAALPVVTVTGVTFVGLLGASVLVESVFALPGLGSELATAAAQHDIPVIQGTVLYFILVVVAVNLLADIAYGLLDPRVAHGRR